MSSEYPIESFKARAEAYFSRFSFSDPVVIREDELVFLDDRSGTKQVSLLTLSTGEVRSLTASTERVLSLKGSAASGKILFGMDQNGDERQQLYVLDDVDASARRITHAEASIHEPGTLSPKGDYVLMRSNARDEATFDIVGMPLGGEPEMWLEGGGQVTAVDMSKDGERALVVRQNGNLDADLLLIDREGSIRNLTEHEGEQWVYGATFDEDDMGVWLLSNLDRDYVALMQQDIVSGERRVIYEADWDVEEFKVSPDSKQIALSVNEDGVSKPVIIQVNGDAAETVIDVPTGVLDGFSWLPDSQQVFFGFSTVEKPSVLMSSNVDGVSKIVADATVDSGLEQEPVTFPAEPVRYATFDGLDIPAFLLKPEGDGPFPVLIDIHGGPESQRRPNYAPSGPVLQYLTSLGMMILTLNVRGSTGYGKEYSHLDDKDKRLDAVKDVEYAVKWLRERDDVISDKIAVYGRSYGGFMTLASLVFYPDLWAAGVEMVGIANFVSFLERTGPWRRKHREAEYGELANDREMLERISPLNYIDNIRAPLMVCHGEHDPRVPLFEAEQVVEAVRNQGQDVVLRVYEDEGHALSKRPNVLDAFALMGAFLTKHLQLR